MSIRQTPGLWFDYVSIPIFAAPGGTTVILVPNGSTFYLDYAMFGTYNAIPDLLGLYLAADGVAILLLTQTQQAAQVSFDRPLVVANALTVGALGTLDSAKNTLVAFSGQMI